jgi:membrane protein DedA with SNARE-associated domain
MTIAALLQQHVYAAALLGSVVEGETAVVLAGFASHRGYASWWAVAALAAGANLLSDQAYYALGRWRGAWLLERLPALQRVAERIVPRLHAHRRKLTFGIRFMYGLRIAGPLVLGVARVPWPEFLAFNALGAVVWAATFTTLGWLFGQTVTLWLGPLAHVEAGAVLTILAAGAVWLLVYALRRRHQR